MTEPKGDYPFTVLTTTASKTYSHNGRIYNQRQIDATCDWIERQHTEYAAMRFASEQVALGAPILDVNVGAPMVDEALLLPELVQRLTGKYAEPLSLDSSHAEAIAAALPFCPGSPLVNSISGEAGRMEHLGPLCRQWGAPFILLPIQGRKLPVKAADRIAIIEDMLDKAAMLGIPRRLVLVDVLALAVASKAEAAREGLETIRWCAAHGLATTIGLSNISFGLPARELVNTTFLSMAMGAGLSSCIANPSSGRLREAKAAGDVLMGHDRDAAAFVNGYATWTPGNGGTADAAAFARAAAQTVEEAVILGDRESVVGLVEKELEAGADPFELVRGRLINFSGLWRAVLLFTAAALFFLPVAGPAAVPWLLLGAGIAQTLVVMLLWAMLADVAHHSTASPLVIFASGWLAYSLPLALGETAGVLLGQLESPAIAVTVLAYVVTVTVVLALNDSAFAQRRIFADLDVAAPVPAVFESLDAGCERLGAECGLTVREVEVLQMLVKGPFQILYRRDAVHFREHRAIPFEAHLPEARRSLQARGARLARSWRLRCRPASSPRPPRCGLFLRQRFQVLPVFSMTWGNVRITPFVS